MRAWIIYKAKESELTEEHFETKRFLEEAEQMGIKISVYRPDQIDVIVTSEDRKSIFVDGHQVPLPDFVLPRMGSGTSYFALALIRHLERLGVFCINSSVSIDTVKDKLFTHQILAESRLPVPKTMLLKFPVDHDHVEGHMGFPLIVKTLSGSLGRGVFLAENRDKFEDLARIIEIANPNMNIILQEMIQSSYGKDLRVFVVGGRVIGSMMRESKDNDYRANYSAGGTVRSFPLTEEIEWLALEATKILGLNIAGVDLLFDKDNNFKICEVNSSPMFKGMESCNDINVPEEIFKYIKTRVNHS
ncbi:ATP-grasp domain-containing protein [Natronospora cellulosivora (SeqCode)]